METIRKPLELYKILLIGDSTVGKTNLTYQFCNNSLSSFEESHLPTIGIDFKIKDVNLNGKVVKLQIWDTAGQERFRTLSKAYYRGSNGVVFVFDICNEESFDHIQDWTKIFDLNANAGNNAKKILVGNKSDKSRDRIVDRSVAEEFAAENNMKYFETSAKFGWLVEEVFMTLAFDIRDYRENTKNDEYSDRAIKLGNNSKSKHSKMSNVKLKNWFSRRCNI